MSAPFADPRALGGWDPERDLGFPGTFPFTRGIQPTMYRGRLWTMRQYAGFGTAEESNRRYRYLLDHGVTGLSVAFDLPTQMGYDSDHPLAQGEVGRVGVAIDSLDDMAQLLDGIPLDRVSTSMTINATAIILLALYVAVARRQGVPGAALSGTIQNDVLKEYVARGTYIYPPRQSLRIITDIVRFCETSLPSWNSISISGYHIREAGSTAVQEVAFTFANAVAYVEAARAAGLDVDRFAQRISFFFNAHNDFCEEVAKFRAARRQGAALADLAGTVQNDILKEYIARGTYIYPPRASLRIVTDVFAFCAREMPQWNTISISGYHIREAGSTAVQEIAFTLANGIAYVDAAIRTGLDVNAFGQRLSFFFNCHNNFLEEIAKFRAARRLWAHIMRDRFGATNPRAQQLRFHTQTAGSTLTAHQPENNIVRVALQALAAVLGGTQSLHCNALDEALSLPSEEAARLALRTQQIIAAETGAANTVDPVGGAYTIEVATERLESEARALLDRIDGLGGTLAAIETGMIQREIQDAAYRAQQAVDSGESVVVGVNKYVRDADAQRLRRRRHRTGPGDRC